MSKVARLGDPSSHGGTISAVSSVNVFVDGIAIALDGDSHSCPIPGHGTTSISAITSLTHGNSKLILTVGAIAGCGAVINDGSPDTNCGA